MDQLQLSLQSAMDGDSQAAINTVLQLHHDEMQALKDGHTTTLAVLEQKHLENIQKLKEADLAKDAATVTDAHVVALETKDQAKEEAVQVAKESNNDEQNDEEPEIKNDEMKNDEMKNEILKIEKSMKLNHEKEKEFLLSNHNDSLVALKEGHSTTVHSLETLHLTQLTTMAQEHQVSTQQQLQQQLEQQVEQLEQLQIQHTVEIAVLVTSHTSFLEKEKEEKEKQEKENQENLQSLQNQLKEQLNQLQEQKQQKDQIMETATAAQLKMATEMNVTNEALSKSKTETMDITMQLENVIRENKKQTSNYKEKTKKLIQTNIEAYQKKEQECIQLRQDYDMTSNQLRSELSETETSNAKELQIISKKHQLELAKNASDKLQLEKDMVVLIEECNKEKENKKKILLEMESMKNDMFSSILAKHSLEKEVLNAKVKEMNNDMEINKEKTKIEKLELRKKYQKDLETNEKKFKKELTEEFKVLQEKMEKDMVDLMDECNKLEIQQTMDRLILTTSHALQLESMQNNLDDIKQKIQAKEKAMQELNTKLQKETKKLNESQETIATNLLKQKVNGARLALHLRRQQEAIEKLEIQQTMDHLILTTSHASQLESMQNNLDDVKNKFEISQQEVVHQTSVRSKDKADQEAKEQEREQKEKEEKENHAIKSVLESLMQQTELQSIHRNIASTKIQQAWKIHQLCKKYQKKVSNSSEGQAKRASIAYMESKCRLIFLFLLSPFQTCFIVLFTYLLLF